ncbi:16S rRNA (cytosine(1402)-N(4))-methyltransferase RsmH [Patescibacteria group bacterium]|nr:MAG: 16S rRNA (cytosine(1402)-N(4))-methyltransferase RsmH [Patescibacteria group bacterium]
MTHVAKHVPVLLEQTVKLLDPNPGELYFDGTAGYGGHAAAIAERIAPDGFLILADRDHRAIHALQQRFNNHDRVRIMRRDYLSATEELLHDRRLVDMVLLDLGVSSPQLDNPERGFSFMAEAPLDMRMDQSQSPSAADVVNAVSEKDLADLIYQYGGERRSRRIAAAIVRQRPISTTTQLAKIVEQAVGGRGASKIHPATKTFQALRIHVNQELEQLEQALPKLVRLLKPGGRIAVISFHSLEDGLVKEFFNRESKDCTCPPKQPVCTCDHVASLKKLTTKPVAGTEDAFNPRARSAKLRAAVKINQNQKEG